jgi:hypothetical protein
MRSLNGMALRSSLDNAKNASTGITSGGAAVPTSASPAP